MKKKFVWLVGCVILSFCGTNVYAQPVAVDIQVDATTAGYRVNNDFVGFSFEGKTMTTEGGAGSTVASFWEASSTGLIRFRNILTNLSPSSVIRIGANTGDQLTWTSGNRGTNTDVSRLYNSDIDKVFTFLGSVNWKCL